MLSLLEREHLPMATLTKADAARQFGISRTTLYKLINEGKLSATPEGLIDTAELVRVMSTLNVHLWTRHLWTRIYTAMNTMNVQWTCPLNVMNRCPVNVS